MIFVVDLPLSLSAGNCVAMSSSLPFRLEGNAEIALKDLSGVETPVVVPLEVRQNGRTISGATPKSCVNV